VRYTEVLNHEVRGEVHLTGTVESRTESVVASEVAGLIVELNVLPGDYVRVGEALARIRTVPYELGLRAAEGRRKEARARLDQALRKLQRAQDLFDSDVVSQDHLDDAFSEHVAWQGRLDQADAEIDHFKIQLDRCIIRAPYEGAIVAKRVDVGEWIEIGGAAVEMIALERLQVRIDVPERYYDLLSDGEQVRVELAALPGLQLDGAVHRIVARADPKSRTFPVKVRIPNPEGRVGVGMLAQVALSIGTGRRACVVPKDALIRLGGKELVYRITTDETVETVPVESLQGLGDWVVVEGEVRAGDRVVTRGNERLQPGQFVQGILLEYPAP
jgi:RND family efflux transporter MFP subunit